MSREPTQLRALGAIVLAVGIAGAGVRYWVERRAEAPVMDEVSAPGYLRAQHRDMGRMMGQFGLILSNWQAALDEPAVQAALIVVVSALVGLAFFKIASGLEAEEQAHGGSGSSRVE